MRRISTGFFGLTTAVALMFAGCGDDPTGVDSGDQLTVVEVAALLAELVRRSSRPAPGRCKHQRPPPP